MVNNKFSENSGFSAIEIIVVVLVVSVALFGGWYVWQANQTKLASEQQATQAFQTNPDPYQGWKTYCDNVEHFCFKYPDGLAVETTEDGVTLKDSTNNIFINYASHDTRDSAVSPYHTASIDSTIASADKLKVIGGFTVTNNPLPEYKVVDASLLSSRPLVVGAEAPFIDTARFKNSRGDQGSLRAYPIGRVFTVQEAKDWFATNAAKQSALILKSLYKS